MKLSIKNLQLLITAYLLVFTFTAVAQENTKNLPNAAAKDEIVKIEAEPEKGFAYPYYLYIPSAMREISARGKTRSLLVIPNNTGKINDDLEVHEADVKRKIPQIGAFINGKFKVVILIPVFPRPATEHNIYTHSLDRDVMLTGKKEFSRYDLQLKAMIEHARGKLESEKIQTEKKILMQGYSASGMFVNRFVFLHPELIKAAAIGAPGGWAIAPTGEYNGKTLRFPVGTSDFKEISGRKFDVKKVRKIPIFMILGGKDTNDAVPAGDAYDKEDSDLVIDLFGKTPVERWEISKKVYAENKLNAAFKLYPNATHQLTDEMREDMISFFKNYVR
jgi:dienelactone hydrolase